MGHLVTYREPIKLLQYGGDQQWRYAMRLAVGGRVHACGATSPIDRGIHNDTIAFDILIITWMNLGFNDPRLAGS